jgi:Fe-S cluster biogenesis protein NfuA
MDLDEKVRATLERSVAPAVIARGGNVRLLSVEDGVVTLEASGSPGAIFPVRSRIEALLRNAVPEVTALRIVPGEEPAAAGAEEDLDQRVRRALDEEINPAIAAHRGRVTLVGCSEGWIRIRLEGGCQGCSLAEVTVRQGIEPLLRARAPEIVGILDVTDHEAGTEPFFSSAKR